MWLLLACTGKPKDVGDPDDEPTDSGTPTNTVQPDTVGVVSLPAQYAILDLGETQRRFHLQDQVPAWTTPIPIAADFDGDGLHTIAVAHTALGTLYYGPDNATRGPTEAMAFTPGTWPLVGDFDGDGVDDDMGWWDATGSVVLAAPTSIIIEPGSAFPVVGDFNGDGTDTVAAYNYADGSYSLYDLPTADPRVHPAPIGGYPVAGDLNGDGIDAVGVYDGVGSLTWLDEQGNPGQVQEIGAQSYLQFPLAGKWSASGTVDENGGWEWPEGKPTGFDEQQLGNAVERWGSLEHSNSLLVVQDGVLVQESYFRGYDRTMANCVKSVSKSILSALFLVAVQDKVLSLDDPISDWLPGYFDVPTDITIAHLMTMSAGLAWHETDSFSDWSKSEDWVAWALEQPAEAAPGKTYNYSTALSHIGSAVLQSATGMATHEYAQTKLFEPLGIEFTRWDVDPTGVDVGGAEVWMRPRDMARFGALYLENGSLDGTEILWPEAVEASFTNWIADYGLWWRVWTIRGHDCWIALGYGGQMIAVVPTLDLVVVTTSEWAVNGTQATEQEWNTFYLLRDFVIPAVEG